MPNASFFNLVYLLTWDQSKSFCHCSYRFPTSLLLLAILYVYSVSELMSTPFICMFCQEETPEQDRRPLQVQCCPSFTENNPWHTSRTLPLCHVCLTEHWWAFLRLRPSVTTWTHFQIWMFHQTRFGCFQIWMFPSCNVCHLHICKTKNCTLDSVPHTFFSV